MGLLLAVSSKTYIAILSLPSATNSPLSPPGIDLDVVLTYTPNVIAVVKTKTKVLVKKTDTLV